jgi:hypothetical protein
MRFAVSVFVLAAALGGCANSQVGGSLFYLTPYKLSELECEELAKRVNSAAGRVRKSEELMSKAATDPAGPLINTAVYGPEYRKARWELDVYTGEAARRNCPVTIEDRSPEEPS